MVKAAKRASDVLGQLSVKEKNLAISRMADSIAHNTKYLLRENAKDIKIAKRKRLKSSFVDRLVLSPKRIKGMIASLGEIVKLEDVVGQIQDMRRRPNGLLIAKMRVPIGVIGIIYESRPNVTSDCVGLCIKSGNSVVLKGGSEALNSNKAIFNCLQSAIADTSVPKDSIAFVTSKGRDAVAKLLKLRDYVDLIIPRGGESLINEVAKKSLIPVVKHYKAMQT
jgi:glutamate-5-semialdehyde dehydrogenase